MNHHFKHTIPAPEDEVPEEHSPEAIFGDPDTVPYRITGEAFMIDVEPEIFLPISQPNE